jgi:quinol monooxygenase YgiN
MADRVLAITLIHGIAGRRGDLRALMRDTAERVASEPRCRMYHFAVMLDDADEYIHVQEWADEEAFDAHQRSPAFRDYQRGLFDLLSRASDMEIHRGRQPVHPEPSGPPDPRAVD